jgi:cytochrome c biogenesis protein CcmG/thiol:disulfide interchange protein DsbE
VKLGEQFKGTDLVLLKVAVKEKEESVEKYKQEFHISSPLLFDDRAKVANAYGVWSHPSTYFINGEGKIVARVIGGRDWTSGSMKSFIQDLLKEKG